MNREIILDTETTGLYAKSGDRIVEIGCVEIINKRRTGNVFHRYINPERDMPIEAFKVHGISAEFLKDKPKFSEIAKEFIDFIGDAKLVIHNAGFDIGFINFEFSLLNIKPVSNEIIDTLNIARKKFPGSPASLDALCKRFNVSLDKRDKHGALLDADLLTSVYLLLLDESQSSMFDMAEKTVAESFNVVRTFREARNYVPSADELEQHEKFINGLSDAIWKKIQS
jgi:DNA polymerase-3 subunit epsilon